jgi:hypothetical protein
MDTNLGEAGYNSPSGPHQSLPPTTTASQEETLAGQRKINLVWELTQSAIAIMIVLANVTAALFNVFHENSVDVPTILSSALFMVLGFYLARTNHQAIGGTGTTPTQPYIGR